MSNPVLEQEYFELGESRTGICATSEHCSRQISIDDEKQNSWLSKSKSPKAPGNSRISRIHNNPVNTKTVRPAKVPIRKIRC
jgi:hypothetical protein